MHDVIPRNDHPAGQAVFGPPRFQVPRCRWVLNAFLDWVLALDAGYRERARLKRLDDAHLRDIGLTRADLQIQENRSHVPDHWTVPPG